MGHGNRSNSTWIPGSRRDASGGGSTPIFFPNAIFRERDMELLYEVVVRYRPEWIFILNYLGLIPLKVEWRRRLCDLLGKELGRCGIDSEEELNPRGKELEALIDKIWAWESQKLFNRKLKPLKNPCFRIKGGRMGQRV